MLSTEVPAGPGAADAQTSSSAPALHKTTTNHIRTCGRFSSSMWSSSSPKSLVFGVSRQIKSSSVTALKAALLKEKAKIIYSISTKH